VAHFLSHPVEYTFSLEEVTLPLVRDINVPSRTNYYVTIRSCVVPTLTTSLKCPAAAESAKSTSHQSTQTPWRCSCSYFSGKGADCTWVGINFSAWRWSTSSRQNVDRHHVIICILIVLAELFSAAFSTSLCHRSTYAGTNTDEKRLECSRP